MFQKTNKRFLRILSTWLLLLIAEAATLVHSTFRAIKSQTPEADNICSINYPTQPRMLPKVGFFFLLTIAIMSQEDLESMQKR